MVLTVLFAVKLHMSVNLFVIILFYLCLIYNIIPIYRKRGSFTFKTTNRFNR